MIQCLYKRKSLQATHNLTRPMNRHYLPSPISIYRIQNSPKHVRWPRYPNQHVKVLVGAGCQPAAPGTDYLLQPWLTQQKTLLLLKNSTNTQIYYREDIRVKRDYKNAATLEANLLKFKQNPNKILNLSLNTLDCKKAENKVWIMLTLHLLALGAARALCTFPMSIHTCA